MVDQQEDKYKDVNKGKGEDIEICRYKKNLCTFLKIATKKVSYTIMMTLTKKTKKLIAI